tara:strand:+ start:187 stop:675 length:489 start_codon:yes stop_codon:yes gene_type:complete
MKKNLDFRNPLTFISTGFGLGLFPVAPGTVSSFFAAIFYLFFFDPFISNFYYLLLFICFILLSLVLGILIYPLTTNSDKDPPYFVWDEFVGMWIACLPVSFTSNSFTFLIYSFVLFRLFDIWKPWIIQYFNKMENGMGVMMDDIFAGLFSCFFVSLTIYILS